MRKMKDSGIAWIGEIPENWNLQRGKTLFRQRQSKGNAELVLLSATQKQGMIPQEFVEGCVQVKEDTDLQTFKTVHKNDFVISLRSFQGGFEISDYEGVCSPAYQVFYSLKDICHSYWKYLFKSDGFISKMNSLTVGIREGKNIQYTDFANSLLTSPPLSEQQRIADYLDSQCAKIDSTITKTQQIIEKLKAYKQSVIAEAVTKGLNPDVPMKDSGVEWIGKMPSHWKVCKFGVVASVKSNLVSPEKYPELPQVSPENIEKGSGKILPCQTVEESGVISWNHLFYKGQILYSKIRPRLNKVTIAPFDGLCSADMYPIETSQDYDFIKYMMLADSFVEQVILVTENRVKMPKINQNELGQILVCIPNIDEQKQIASYLDDKCARIDGYIAKKQEVIEKLTAYKKSLIFEVVTGKKEI